MACFGMTFERRQLVHNEPKRLLLPGILHLVYSKQSLDFGLSFFDFTVEQMHEFLCTLDRFER